MCGTLARESSVFWLPISLIVTYWWFSASTTMVLVLIGHPLSAVSSVNAQDIHSNCSYCILMFDSSDLDFVQVLIS